MPPQLGVMQGISKLALPQASTIENLSYGNQPFTMPPSGTGAMIPQAKTGRKPEIADLVSMISGVPGAGAVADVGTKLSNQAADALVRAITRNPQATAPGVLQETAMPFVSAATPKYFNQIPETTKEIDRITDFLSKRAENSGFNVRTGASNVSGSRYVTIQKDMPDDEMKSIEIRVSNHGDRHPFTYADEKISIDPVTGTTLQDVLGLLDDRGFKLRKTNKTEKRDFSSKYGLPSTPATETDIQRISQLKQERMALEKQAFGDPTQPNKVTDYAAFSRLLDLLK